MDCCLGKTKMNEFAHRERVCALLDTYNSLLSLTQKEVLTDYYAYDLSLSEIASNRGNSRAAVDDALKKGEKKLFELESSLKILQRSEELKGLAKEAKVSGDYSKLEEYINGI